MTGLEKYEPYLVASDQPTLTAVRYAGGQSVACSQWRWRSSNNAVSRPNPMVGSIVQLRQLIEGTAEITATPATPDSHRDLQDILALALDIGRLHPETRSAYA